MIKTDGLSHIHLYVLDLNRSLRFYENVFGMKERFRDGPAMVFLNTPGSRDVITLHEDKKRKTGESGGIAHFGFRLRNKKGAEGKSLMDSAILEVEKFGGKLLRRGEHTLGHPFAYIADPDGYEIEL